MEFSIANRELPVMLLFLKRRIHDWKYLDLKSASSSISETKGAQEKDRHVGKFEIVSHAKNIDQQYKSYMLISRLSSTLLLVKHIKKLIKICQKHFKDAIWWSVDAT